MMIPLPALRLVDVLSLSAGAWILYSFFQTVRQRVKTTKLNGPRSNSWFWGLSRHTFEGDSGALYEQWAKEHGTIFAVPGMWGSRRIILTDAKAISHFYANETYTYLQGDLTKNFIDSLVRGWFCMLGLV